MTPLIILSFVFVAYMLVAAQLMERPFRDQRDRRGRGGR